MVDSVKCHLLCPFTKAIVPFVDFNRRYNLQCTNADLDCCRFAVSGLTEDIH